MEIEELVVQIRRDIKAVREKGQEVIGAAALDQYLVDVEKNAGLTSEERRHAREAQLQHFKASHESNLAHYNAKNQQALEMLRSVITVGQSALKSAMLINGGAAVAILGFLSNAWTKDVPQGVIQTLPESLLSFVIGVLAAALASGFTYLSQECFASDRELSARILRAVVVSLVLASYAAFGLGAWQSYLSFSGGSS